MVDQAPSATASLILALHARFEANNAEYQVIEAARPANDDFAERGKIDRAIRASEAEADALRFAILTQVPDSREDALVLMFHIRIEQDAQSHCAKPPSDAAKSILGAAIDALFDFLACEDRFDHFDPGDQLRSARDTAFYARRYRTGVMGA